MLCQGTLQILLAAVQGRCCAPCFGFERGEQLNNMLDDCVMIEWSTAVKFSILVSKHGQDNVVSEIIEEGNDWLEIGRYMLHDFWKPCQV